jgi:secreted PhoX family phosphatase
MTRRGFIARSTAAGAALMISGALEKLFARVAAGAPLAAEGYGPLEPDPGGLLDLPHGFHYRVFSTAWLNSTSNPRFSQMLSNGEFVPSQHDGMGAFEGPGGRTVLVRNHEVDLRESPGVDEARVRPYDALGHGGTTTLWVGSDRELVRAVPSLSGTIRNCAGRATTFWMV